MRPPPVLLLLLLPPLLLLLAATPALGAAAAKKGTKKGKAARRRGGAGLTEGEAAACGEVSFLFDGLGCERFLAAVSASPARHRTPHAHHAHTTTTTHAAHARRRRRQHWETTPLLTRRAARDAAAGLFRSADLPRLLGMWPMKVNAEHGCALPPCRPALPP